MASVGMFSVLAAWYLIASQVNHIDDCDEVFGYYEPLHYLMSDQRVGLQTWEYAPSYSIRTYSFIYPFYVLMFPLQYMGCSKLFIFQVIRSVIGLCAAYSQTLFVQAIRDRIDKDVSSCTLFLILFSPGCFYCSTSYLPSAIGSSVVMLSSAHWMNHHYPASILFGSVAVLCTGWPFIGLLLVPIGLSMIHNTISINPSSLVAASYSLLQLIMSGLCIVALVQLPVLLLDFKFYGRITSPTLNILRYNAIGGSGDELYGVEPVSYYVRNLFLNMGLSWVLVLLSPVMALLLAFLKWLTGHRRDELSDTVDDVSRKDSFMLKTALYCQALLWIGVLFSRPHKEERFLYPVYPLLAFMAADSLTHVHQLVVLLSQRVMSPIILSHAKSYSSVKRVLRGVVVMMCLVLSGVLFASRVYSNYVNYSGYLRLWMELPMHVAHLDGATAGAAAATMNICIGREWYLFPSHYFLPDAARLQFVRDNFTGILPQYYPDDGIRNGTYATPLQPFNDRNREEASRYVPLTSCQYLVIAVDGNEPIALQDDVRRAILSAGSGSPSIQHSSHRVNFQKLAEQWVLSTEHSLVPTARAFFIPQLSSRTVKFKSFGLYRVLSVHNEE